VIYEAYAVCYKCELRRLTGLCGVVV
jgi:hypothetical protein